ncbi:hypothetical protein C8F01DRAFT_1253287 [Mycena amicta]|nr:hypothetical protein C8F01DRAFT_1253287 [Mycena amicta]
MPSASFENKRVLSSHEPPASPTTTAHAEEKDLELEQPPAFNARFLDKTPAAAAARAVYFKTVFGGVTALCVAIFAIFSIYWGSVWSSPHHPLHGWIVDFDGGIVGQSISHALSSIDPGSTGVVWRIVPASEFLGGIAQIESQIVDEKTWYAITINAGASANLTSAVATADASYNSTNAITFIGSEARNENIYRLHVRIVSAQLEAITYQFGLSFLKNISSAANLPQLLATAPAIVSRPVYFSAVNLRPFDVPCQRRDLCRSHLPAHPRLLHRKRHRRCSTSRLPRTTLTLRSLILLRLLTSFVAYFFVALFYTLLSRAFQLPFDRVFGSAGFVVFWMLNFIGMLACGLALEAMLLLLTIRFVPFFLMLWIITNVAACVFPIAALPHVYRYGYVFPMYNISRAVRAIVFRTKNEVGINFAVLFVWTFISCLTIPLFHWFARRRTIRAQRRMEKI